jgi:Tfp pilus assembly protein FimT
VWGYKGKSKSEAVALGRRYLKIYQNKKNKWWNKCVDEKKQSQWLIKK